MRRTKTSEEASVANRQHSVTQMLNKAKGKSFATKDVIARLDEADAFDRTQAAARQARRPPPIDLGKD